MKSSSQLIAFVGILLVSVMLTYSLFAEDSKHQDKKRVRWEHSALTHNEAEVDGHPQLASQIVRMGNEGWQLVSVSTIEKEGTTVKTILYFNRLKDVER